MAASCACCRTGVSSRGLVNLVFITKRGCARADRPLRHRFQGRRCYTFASEFSVQKARLAPRAWRKARPSISVAARIRLTLQPSMAKFALRFNLDAGTLKSQPEPSRSGDRG